jgi:spermidine synthase
LRVIFLGRHDYQLLWSGNSADDHLEVIQTGNVRELRVNQVWQGACYLDNPLKLPTPYMQQMLLALLYARQIRRILFIGLGTGCLPRVVRYLYPKAVMDIVEIDPVIVRIARDYFDFKTDVRLRLHITDGTKWLLLTKNQYDIVFLDAFTGDEMPKGFHTRTFMWQVKQALYPGGVFSVNIPRHIWYVQEAVLRNIRRYLGQPRLYDPVNSERHDDLNLVALSPVQELTSRTRQRKNYLKKHETHLCLDIEALLNNIYPRSTY